MLVRSACVMLAVLASLACGSTYTLGLQFTYPASNLPKGATLTLRGSGCGLSWTKGASMTASAANEWSINLDCAHGVVQFKSLINDETWQIGANFIVNVTQSGAAAFYPWFYATKYTSVTIDAVYSPQLQNTRGVIIYLPPSYSENTLKQYTDVMLLQDGQNLGPIGPFGPGWNIQPTVSELVVEGAMTDVILVGVYNTPDRMAEYTYSAYAPYVSVPLGNEYLDFLEQTVAPLVSSKIALVDQPQWAILGSSLGGLISCYAGWTRSVYANAGLFAKAGCMSTSFWWNDQSFDFKLMDDSPAPPTTMVFYLDSGTGDGGSSGTDDELETDATVMHMVELGWVLNGTLAHYVQQGGTHNEASWGARFHVPMTFLYAPQPLIV